MKVAASPRIHMGLMPERSIQVTSRLKRLIPNHQLSVTDFAAPILLNPLNQCFPRTRYSCIVPLKFSS